MNELKELLPYASLLLTFAAFYFSRKKDAQDDAATITQINVKMDGMAHDMADVRADIKALRDETRADHDKIVIMQSKVDALGDRVDEIKAKVL